MGSFFPVGWLASPPVAPWPPFHFKEMCPGCCWSGAVCKERRLARQKNNQKKSRGHRINMRTNSPPPHTRLLGPAWSLCMAAHKNKWPFFIVPACLHSIVTRRVQISSFYEPQASHRQWHQPPGPPEAPPSSVLHCQHPAKTPVTPTASPSSHPQVTLKSPQPLPTLLLLVSLSSLCCLLCDCCH